MANKIDSDEATRKLALDIAERNGWTDGEDFEQAQKEAEQVISFLRKSYPKHFN